MNINKTQIARKQKWEEKQLDGRFKQLTNETLESPIISNQE